MLSIVFLVVGILLGYIIGFFITKSKNDAAIAKSKEENTVFKIKAESLNTQIEDLVKKEKETSAHFTAQINQLRAEKEAITIQLTKKEGDVDHLLEKNREQKEEVNQLQEKFSKEFEN